MIDIFNGIGKFINDTTRGLMGAPNPQNMNQTRPQSQVHPQNAPCTTCAQKAEMARQPQMQQAQQMQQQMQQMPNTNPNQVVFNTEKQATVLNQRQAGQPIPEPNLRNVPYTNTSGMKFN